MFIHKLKKYFGSFTVYSLGSRVNFVAKRIKIVFRYFFQGLEIYCSPVLVCKSIHI